jgi:2-polyprenyl-3-methyl-5-hydroxy-6-metoxy-1,4-benzoquinol methylase
MSNTVPKENDYCAYFDSAGFSSLKRISDNYFIAPDVSGTWRDSPQSEVTALVDQINSGSAWRDVVYRYTDQKSTEWLEKVVMSPSRSLFLELFDFSKVNSVLDFGSGWGQLTRPLASRVPFVMSVEPNQERLMVNEAISRQEGFDNICYLQASDVSLPL